MDNISSTKRQTISLKRLKPSSIKHKLSLNCQENYFKQAENTSIKKITNFHKRQSLKQSKITLNTRHTSNIEKTTPIQNKHQLHHKSMSATKFTRFSLNNPISINRDETIERLIEEIIPKSQCFYRFGFKSYEKPMHKRVFSDIMCLSKQEMRGLLFVGELWDNEMTQQFMKANNVNYSKRELNEKLRDIKWSRVKKEKEHPLDSRKLINSVQQFNQQSQRSIQSYQQELDCMLQLNRTNSELTDSETIKSDFLSTTSSQRLQRNEQFQQISKTFRQSLDNIRNSIDEESRRCRNQQYWRKMKGLQKQSTQIHHIWDRYFQKLIQNK